LSGGSPRLAAILAATALSAAPSNDAWQRLDALRSNLNRSGVLSARFTQTFIPAGFSDGDTESGNVWLALPDCLRWDYTEPDAKSFLLCGSELHSWVPGDQAGRRLRVEPRNEAGLDLLLLPLAILEQRYRAELRGANELELRSSTGGGSMHQARLTSDPRNQRLLRLETTDSEGNVSRFDFSAWANSPERDRFDPPSLEWLDEAQR
jgi:outer membrane lipoprotein-sorting protein